MPTFKIPLRIVFYRQDGDWVAHCLEFDLCGDGATTEEALENLHGAIVAQVDDVIQHGNPANLFSPAPSKYLQMFAAGKNVVVGHLHIDVGFVEIEGVQAREYEDGLVPA